MHHYLLADNKWHTSRIYKYGRLNKGGDEFKRVSATRNTIKCLIDGIVWTLYGKSIHRASMASSQSYLRQSSVRSNWRRLPCKYATNIMDICVPSRYEQRVWFCLGINAKFVSDLRSNLSNLGSHYLSLCLELENRWTLKSHKSFLYIKHYAFNCI